MLPAVLNAALALSDGGRPAPDVAHAALEDDLRNARVTWRRDDSEWGEDSPHAVASIAVPEEDEVLEIHVPCPAMNENPLADTLTPIGFRFVTEDMSGDLLLAPRTVAMLAAAIPADLHSADSGETQKQ